MELFSCFSGYFDITLKRRYIYPMMKKLLFSGFAVMALVMAAATSAWPQQHHTPRPGGPKMGMESCPHMKGKAGHPPMFFGNPVMFKQELGLTDQQIAKIEQINLNHHKLMLNEREKLEPKRIQLERLLLEENINLNNVRNLLREIADIRIDIHMLKITHRLEIEKVLTQEQKTKLKAMRGRHPKMGPGMRHHGPDEF